MNQSPPIRPVVADLEPGDNFPPNGQSIVAILNTITVVLSW